MLSIGSGDDTSCTFSFEPLSALAWFVAILWQSLENIFSAHRYHKTNTTLR
jgi:hypothetical protein